MLDNVGKGYARRLGLLRKAWDVEVAPSFRTASQADVEACGRRLRHGSPEALPLDVAALSGKGHVRVDMFARILGRDYARNGSAAFDAILRAGAAIGLSRAAADPGWRLVGQAVLDASIGIWPGDPLRDAPALACDGVGDEHWLPFANLSRHLEGFLRHAPTDWIGLLEALGVVRGHAEWVLSADCHWTTGSFVAGLVEGLSRTDWEDASISAYQGRTAGPTIEPEAFPMAIAAHLALQSAQPKGRYELPGFGTFQPGTSAAG